MPYPCRLIEHPERDDRGRINTSKRAVGDMWFIEATDEWLQGHPLSGQYLAENRWRKPLVVLLPDARHGKWPYPFLIDGQCYSQKMAYYGGWNVTGKPPLLTVTPSINVEGRYHGYLTKGVLSDSLPL